MENGRPRKSMTVLIRLHALVVRFGRKAVRPAQAQMMIVESDNK